MLGIGGHEFLIIAVVFVVIFFGGKKIPELAGGFGKGIREFKNGLKEFKGPLDDVSKSINGNLNEISNEISSEIKDVKKQFKEIVK